LSPDCSRTLTIDMARPGGQFGSHFNMEVLSFSLIGYMTKRTVIFEMQDSYIGRWCRFFLATGTCPPHNKSTAFAVERLGGGKVNTHWMFGDFARDHLYFSYSDYELLSPVYNLLAHHLRKNYSPAETLSLIRKFVLFLWQLPDELAEQVGVLVYRCY
jgi:hypothetical protein